MQLTASISPITISNPNQASNDASTAFSNDGLASKESVPTHQDNSASLLEAKASIRSFAQVIDGLADQQTSNEKEMDEVAVPEFLSDSSKLQSTGNVQTLDSHSLTHSQPSSFGPSGFQLELPQDSSLPSVDTDDGSSKAGSQFGFESTSRQLNFDPEKRAPSAIAGRADWEAGNTPPSTETSRLGLESISAEEPVALGQERTESSQRINLVPLTNELGIARTLDKTSGHLSNDASTSQLPATAKLPKHLSTSIPNASVTHPQLDYFSSDPSSLASPKPDHALSNSNELARESKSVAPSIQFESKAEGALPEAALTLEHNKEAPKRAQASVFPNDNERAQLRSQVPESTNREDVPSTEINRRAPERKGQTIAGFNSSTPLDGNLIDPAPNLRQNANASPLGTSNMEASTPIEFAISAGAKPKRSSSGMSPTQSPQVQTQAIVSADELSSNINGLEAKTELFTQGSDFDRAEAVNGQLDLADSSFGSSRSFDTMKVITGLGNSTSESEGDLFGVAKQIKAAVSETLRSSIASGVRESSSVQLRLEPVHLGLVQVDVSTEESAVKLQIIAEKWIAHSIIEQRIDNLIESLSQGGTRSVEVEVFHQSSSDHSNGFMDSNHQQENGALNESATNQDRQEPDKETSLDEASSETSSNERKLDIVI